MMTNLKQHRLSFWKNLALMMGAFVIGATCFGALLVMVVSFFMGGKYASNAWPLLLLFTIMFGGVALHYLSIAWRKRDAVNESQRHIKTIRQQQAAQTGSLSLSVKTTQSGALSVAQGGEVTVHEEEIVLDFDEHEVHMAANVVHKKSS